MPEIRTDDGPRKLRSVFLGPDGSVLPVQWTYVQWAVCVALVPLAGAIVGAIVVGLSLLFTGHVNWLIPIGIAVIYGVPGGLYLGAMIMRRVTFDEPLRHKRVVLRAEFGRANRRPQEAPLDVIMPWPLITDLTVKNPPPEGSR